MATLKQAQKISELVSQGYKTTRQLGHPDAIGGPIELLTPEGDKIVVGYDGTVWNNDGFGKGVEI